jgi:hypothetical protein
LKLESSITTARLASDFVMCTSYAAALSELSVSVVALSTVAPGLAASAAFEADVSVEPVSGVSPFPLDDVELPDEVELLDEVEPLDDVEAVECLWLCER